jgi:hypothetical protein
MFQIIYLINDLIIYAHTFIYVVMHCLMTVYILKNALLGDFIIVR